MHIDKGIYVTQLRRWFSLFGPCQFWIGAMEDVYMGVSSPKKDPLHHTREAFGRLLRWSAVPLTVSNKTLDELFLKKSLSNRPGVERGKLPENQLSLAEKRELGAFYKPYNAELFKLLALSRGWEDGWAEVAWGASPYREPSASAAVGRARRIVQAWQRAHPDYVQ